MACGPPHWADHLAAARIARRAGLPFAMDLRDPWSLVERLPSSLASPVWLWRSRRDEQRSLRQAELVVMNTEGARDAMRALHPTASDRIEAVMNGVDGEPLPAPAPGEQDDDGAFVAAYAGTVYLDRDPSGLFRAAARVVEEQGLSPARFRIEFMGEAPEAEIARAAAAAGIPDHVVVHPRGTRDEASAFLERAALLLSLPQDSHLAVPSKIFEYMRFPAALLALAAPGSATAILLRDSEADVVDPGDVDGIAEVLARRFREFAAGKRPSPLAGDPRFGRRRQADHLFDRIERLASGPR
jgi:glycosyltransferase involved in cell wall biosynthesis